MRPAALDYYECAALIHGADAPGMPATEDVAEVEVECKLADLADAGGELCDTAQLMSVIETIEVDEKPVEKFDHRRGPGRPPKWNEAKRMALHNAVMEHGTESWTTIGVVVGYSGSECRRQWLLLDQARHRTTLPDYFMAKRKTLKPPPRPVLHLTPDCCSDMKAAFKLFASESTVGNPESPCSVDTIDLICHEDSDVVILGKKKVHWFGLPDNPPEWKTGQRRQVPRTWEPCRYVDTTPQPCQATEFFHPTLSYEMCTTTLPPPSFWD